MKKPSDMTIVEMHARLLEIQKEGEAYEGELQELSIAQAELIASFQRAVDRMQRPEFNPVKGFKELCAALMTFIKKGPNSGK